MTMEKRGDVHAGTPDISIEELRECREDDGQPTTKEAADRMQRHPINDAIDAAARRTTENRKP